MYEAIFYRCPNTGDHRGITWTCYTTFDKIEKIIKCSLEKIVVVFTVIKS